MQPRSWRDHLAGGTDFPLPSDSEVGSVDSLGAAWARTWTAAPDAPLVRCAADPRTGDGWVNAGELHERAAAAAERLTALGVGPGSRVTWTPDRSLSCVVSHVAAVLAGATVVPLNHELTARELSYVLGDVHPTAFIGAPIESASALGPLFEESGVALVVDHDVEVHMQRERSSGAAQGPTGVAAGSAPALVCYTSGTTGSPKGAVLSHANLLANSRALAAAWRWEPDDQLVHALPLFHGHGLCAALYTSLLVGASCDVLPGFAVDAVVDAAQGRGATLFFGVPTMYHRIDAAGRGGDLAGLRLAVSGSAPLAAELHHRLAATGTAVLERYGMTETLLTVSNPVDGERRAGTVGFPLPGIEAFVHESGELRVRGPQVFSGYLDRPAATAHSFDDGWFCTGDMAEVDEDGYVRIFGRAGDLVISGGFNVYPAEVEDVLLRHPSVAEVAVAGTPSDEWGEVVTAWVVPAGPGFEPDALLRFAAAELAPYKRPRLVRCVSALPRNAMGKVLRAELR